MSGVRRFVEEDVPHVAALRQRSFGTTAQPTATAAEAYFRRIFFGSPFLDPEMPALVYEDENARIVGFVGRLVRRMTLAGEPLRVAITTQLCVDTASPRIIAVQLLNHVLRGPQDLIWSDAATDRVRLLWIRLGGEVARIQSLHWTLDIRPSRSALAGVAGRTTTRALRIASRFLMRDADAAVLRWAEETSRHVSARQVTDAAAMSHERRMRAGANLVSDEDPGAEAWLQRRVAEKAPSAEWSRIVLADEKGSTIGAYSYITRRDATAEVVEFDADAGHGPAVLAHLVRHAVRRGAARLTGRLEPTIADSFGERTVRMTAGAPWSLFHTRRADVRDAIASGCTRFSRLDGEWWLNF